MEKKIQTFVNISTFGGDINQSIRESIHRKLSGTCDSVNGYITEVKKEFKITSSKISSIDCSIIFNVEATVMTIKPKINDKYQGEVVMIFEKGIFIDVKNFIKVLISFDSLNEKDYKYENLTNTFIKDDDVIEIGRLLDIEIQGVKYDKKIYNCFGNII